MTTEAVSGRVDSDKAQALRDLVETKGGMALARPSVSILIAGLVDLMVDDDEFSDMVLVKLANRRAHKEKKAFTYTISQKGAVPLVSYAAALKTAIATSKNAADAWRAGDVQVVIKETDTEKTCRIMERKVGIWSMVFAAE